MWQEGFTEKEQAVAEMCSNLSVILHSVHLNVQSHYDKTERYFTFLKIRIYEFYQQSYYTTCTIFRHLKRKRTLSTITLVGMKTLIHCKWCFVCEADYF